MLIPLGNCLPNAVENISSQVTLPTLSAFMLARFPVGKRKKAEEVEGAWASVPFILDAPRAPILRLFLPQSKSLSLLLNNNI